MADLLELYDLAEEHGTDICWFDLGAAESLSVLQSDGSCAIAMDPWRMSTLADEKVKLAHELGHCETGSFYNRWAYKKLVPEDELRKAIQQGYQEPWELAEYFNVTEPFLRSALDYYRMAAGQ